MSARDHERIEELLAVAALGGLDGEDVEALRAELAEHGPACEECRRLERAYAEVAGRLAFAVDPAPIPDGMQERVVGFATGSAAPLRVMSPRERRRSGPGIRLRPLVAVAASVVVFAAGLGVGALVTGGEARIPADARVVALEGEPGAGSFAVAFVPGKEGIYLLGAELPAPTAGQVYELWMISDGTPAPGACVSPEPDGSLFAFVDAELGAADTMAVTLEPACSDAPTTTPLFVAELA